MYEERYIAFIDILGFKNIVTNTFNFPEEFNRLDQTLSYLESLKRKNYHDPWGNKWMGMEFTMFSDSIVISYPATGNGNAFHILLELAHLCLDVLNMGYIFRGGVTVGPLVHKGDICYGPAMNNAVNLEKRAKYPRIIIEDNVFKRGIQYPGLANTPEQELEYLKYLVMNDTGKFLKGSNPEYILNYLALYNEVDEESMYINLLQKTKSLIINEYNLTLGYETQEMLNIRQKYMWFAGYFNYIVKSILKNYQPYLIDFNI